MCSSTSWRQRICVVLVGHQSSIIVHSRGRSRAECRCYVLSGSWESTWCLVQWQESLDQCTGAESSPAAAVLSSIHWHRRLLMWRSRRSGRWRYAPSCIPGRGGTTKTEDGVVAYGGVEKGVVFHQVHLWAGREDLPGGRSTTFTPPQEAPLTQMRLSRLELQIIP
jgi:hypothetical protein